VDLLIALGWYEAIKQAEGIWLRNLEVDLRSFPVPDYAGTKQVYVALGWVKYISGRLSPW
jgi:hypothetical protein